MEINLVHVPGIITDNEENYFLLLFGILESVDELCHLQITRVTDGYDFRIAPSAPHYLEVVFEEVLKLHNKIGIRLDISKSIKSSGAINFKIKI